MKHDYLRGNGNGCPCKGCGDREIGCHSGCEKYKAWRKKIDARREEEYKQNQGRSTVSDNAVRQMWRELRYQRQQKVRRSDHEH